MRPLRFALMRLGIATVSLTRPQVPKGIVVDAILTDRPQHSIGSHPIGPS
jgi:hypothetical protein